MEFTAEYLILNKEYFCCFFILQGIFRNAFSGETVLIILSDREPVKELHYK